MPHKQGIMEKKDIRKAPEHVNEVERAVREHVPKAGDTYLDRNPNANTFDILRLLRHGAGRWECDVLDAATLQPTGVVRAVSDDTLKSYYRPLLCDAGEVFSAARAIVEGTTPPQEEPQDDPTEALTSTHDAAKAADMLRAAEEEENRLKEIRLAASLIIETRKAELDARMREMEALVTACNRKVRDLVRIITVMNLYLGREVCLQQLADGEPAPSSETLTLRQRILYMDEELCAHIDHEADYRDIGLFLDWVKEPANRDIVIPEQRCVVALKAKRFNMEYRSGDAYYDTQREIWNKHTYLLIRNGGRLWCADDEDLECWDRLFPRKDHQTAFAEKMANPATSFKDHLRKQYEDENYRVLKFAMYLQGLVDNTDILGPFDNPPLLTKSENVRLIRDDEDTLGTSLPSWDSFRDAKNALLRHGNRVIYINKGYFRDGYKSRKIYSSGDFRRWYAHEASEPEPPATGLYHIRKESGDAAFWFSYLPGGTVWPRNLWEDEHERRRHEGWTPIMSYILNYDAVTADELQAYLDDRTRREQFRDMMPTVKRALLEKRKEEADEAAFRELLAADIMKGLPPSYSVAVATHITNAIAWWKGKVTFTRPLRSDDAKAWRMIRARVMNDLK